MRLQAYPGALVLRARDKRSKAMALFPKDLASLPLQIYFGTKKSHIVLGEDAGMPIFNCQRTESNVSCLGRCSTYVAKTAAIGNTMPRFNSSTKW